MNGNTFKSAIGAVSAIFAICASPTDALAQSASTEKSEFRITPYLWAAGFSGTLGVPNAGRERLARQSHRHDV